MALNIPAVADPETGGYIPFLRKELDRRSPVLRERDVWGFRTLRDVFGVDWQRLISQTSSGRASARAFNLHRIAEAELGSLPPETVIGGAGFDFNSVPEPYRTEVKAALSLWLADPQMHCVRSMRENGWIIPFASGLARSATAKRLLADYALDQLASLFASWMAAKGLSTGWVRKHTHPKVDATGVIRLVDVEWIGANGPVSRIIRTLDALRERHKPISERDFILESDLFPNRSTGNNSRAAYAGYDMRFFRVPFIRDAARAYILDRVKHGFRTTRDSTMTLLALLRCFEKCLLAHFEQPTLDDVTKEFYEETFARWGAQRWKGIQWFTNAGAFLNWASQSSLPGWRPMRVDNSSRLLRAHQGDRIARDVRREYDGRMMPEAVVDQIFAAIEAGSMPELLKRLFIVERYTGMRGIDLHRLAFDCLQDDPHDPEFALLRFYQGKVKEWNTKPLKKSEPAHKLVIETIRAQQATAREIVAPLGREPRFLFPGIMGLAERHSATDSTRYAMRRWTLRQKITNADGTPYCFEGWHGMRHLLGTEMALAGHELHVIMMELGHRSPEMSMHYVNRRLDLKKKALLEKGAGRYIDIKGRVDAAVGELVIRKEALTVDVPGGMCAMPGQIGEWCEHNRACFTCTHFRADIEQLAFFERERTTVTATATRLRREIAELEEVGMARRAEIGRRRLARTEEVLANVATITETIKSDGSYRGTERKAQGARGCGSGPECPSPARR